MTTKQKVFNIVKYSLIGLAIIFAIVLVFVVKNTHDLTHTAAVAPTCTKAGNIEHWHCEGCDKNYADKDAKELLQKVSIDKLPHTYDNGVCTACGTEEPKQ